jgi:hypothetical protein
MFQCLNPECKRKFIYLGRKSVQTKTLPRDFGTESVVTVLESPCCPFCGSKEFEEVKENAV